MLPKYQFPIGQDWLLKPLEDVLDISKEGLCFAIATYAINKFLTQGNLTEFYDVLDLIKNSDSTTLKSLIDQQRTKRKDIYKESLMHAEKTYQELLQKQGSHLTFNQIANEKLKDLYLEKEVHKLIDSQIQNHLISFANEEEKKRYFQMKKEEIKNNLMRENTKISVDAIKDDFIYVTSRLFLSNPTINQPIEQIPAFLEELALLQTPYAYSHLFPESIYGQNSQKVFDLINPKKTMRKLFDFPGCFSLQELSKYFKSFIATANVANTPVSLLLNGASHAISINYRPDTGDLALIDANNLFATINIKHEAIDLEAIIKWIFDHLNFGNKENEADTRKPLPVIFTTEMYVNNTGENHELLKWGVDQFEEQRAAINEKAKLSDSFGGSLLFIVCKDGNLDMVNEVIKHNADIKELTAKADRNPLFIASQNGFLKIVQELLKQNAANINQAKSSDGSTPLVIACNNGHLAIVKELLQYNADVNQATLKGVTPLFIACQEGNLAIVKELLEHNANVNQATTDDGTTPLFIACQEGNLAIVKLLLDKNADVNSATNKIGTTPLFIACQESHLEIVKELLEHNADVNQATTDDGSTPLFIACQEGNLAIVKLLLDKKARINQATTDNGSIPLITACEEGHIEIVKELLNHHADVNQASAEGLTPLLMACQKGHLAVVEELLNHGAGLPHMMETYKKSAQDIGHDGILKLLISHQEKKPKLSFQNLSVTLMNPHSKKRKKGEDKKEEKEEGEEELKVKIPKGKD